ncbi:MAG: histidine kinase [Phycisphaerales bacterium]
MVLYAAADLLWATRIKSTAEAMGVAARPARTVEMLRARLADSPVRLLIVDLEAPGAIELIEASKDVVRVVAFGPHVGVEALAQAREAGAGLVLTRGAFDKGLVKLLREESYPS